MMIAVSMEEAIAAAHRRRDFAKAVELGLSAYEREVYSFLVSRLGNESDAHEVFGQLSEDLWCGIGGFAWRCSFRTWLYTLARNAAVRFERSPANNAARRVPLSQVSEPAAPVRSRTRPYQRTAVKDRFATMRASLTPEDQTLLTLRIDRGLSWDEVARILFDAADADGAEVRRLSTNLRQRFRKLTTRISELARAEGLLDEAD